MSPKKILLLGLFAFALLSAATLAYYLPRIQPRAEAAPGDDLSSQHQNSAADGHKPELDQFLLQSIPAHPDDAVAESTTDTVAPQPVPKQSPPSGTNSPISPELADLLKHPPVQFEISSSTLTSGSRRYLDKLAALLQAQPHVELMIEGHTDNQDRLGKNQILSEQRARAVLDYLASKGVNAARLSSTGYGGSRPIADNETAQGRAKNRRIAFEIQS